MASITSKLRLTMKDTSDEKMFFNFNHADPDAQAADVKALGTALVTNKAMFERQPASLEAADFITTEVTPVSLA